MHGDCLDVFAVTCHNMMYLIDDTVSHLISITITPARLLPYPSSFCIQVQTKKRVKLSKMFKCPFCANEDTVECKMDYRASIGSLHCRLCGAAYQMPIHHLNEPIDVFSEWLDDCEAAAGNPQASAAAADGGGKASAGERFDDDDDDDDLPASSGVGKAKSGTKRKAEKSRDLGLSSDEDDDDDDE
jgi:transcription elongation factor Elf1